VVEPPARVGRKEGRWSNAGIDRIELVDYDASWPARFAAEAAAIREALPDDLLARLEHLGSTAVPGLAAKPIIDIGLAIEPALGWGRVITPLASLGYLWWAENPRPDRMFFVKGMPPFGEGRTHHVHVLAPGVEFEGHLVFRDHLRRHAATARRYAELKRELAERFATDREAYTESKSAFVAEILAREGILERAVATRGRAAGPTSGERR
jgi:GrpB-like predicted nucleotidyltransferase (UPF0157 family)